MKATKVYIAASWQNRCRLRLTRDQLKEFDITVTSQWIDFDWGYIEGDFGEEADRDYADIRAADRLILDTTDTTTKGGREWEAGFATGIGKPVVRIGPIITPFHARVSAAYYSWEDYLGQLRSYRAHGDARSN